MTKTEDMRFGFAAIVGRPNVGKSTLLNALVGEKISIVSPKPHTTRHRILGVMNRDGNQVVFLDTPGHARRSKRVLHRLMARAVHQAVEDCDLILFVVEARAFTAEDRELTEMLGPRLERTILVLNKVDALRAKADLLPLLERLGKYPFAAFVPISARTGQNLEPLVEELFRHLPAGPPMFPIEIKTDRSTAFRGAEIIREKLMTLLRQEVPYGLTVEIEHMARAEDGQWIVHALIWLERESHKPIVIGKQGGLLKQAGSEARAELVQLLGDRVHLELWVKVREHWSDSEQALKRLGYDIE
ncbi:MAG TPA: GTPase Era [Gammaproteobacteria bacterium]|nr:GTPase Era [Gammaproteobacteria bacterium]